MKKLPLKWQEHIRKMTEYAQKSNQMRTELEYYLVSKGLTDDSFESGCMFEDSIIDVTSQSYEWGELVHEINLALNGQYWQYVEDITNEKIMRRNLSEDGTV